MVRAFVLAVLTGGVLVIPSEAAVGQGPEDQKRPADPVAILQGQRITYEKDLQTTPFKEVLSDIASRFKVTFVVDKAAFPTDANLDDAKADLLSAQRLEGLPLCTFLDVYFRGLTVEGVTYLVRSDRIEITSRHVAQKEAGLTEAVDEAKATGEPMDLVKAKARLNLPLVCVAVQERPLNLVLKDLGQVYGLNIVIDREVREVLKMTVTERLLNVPADTALELLVGQAGLTVVRKGNTFRVTGNGAA
jgi:hypothetical protein